MTTIIYTGEEANLRVVAEDIADDPALCDACEVRIGVQGNRSEALGHGVWAEMAVSVGSGVITAAISEALRRIVDRARDRGNVSERVVIPESEGTQGEERNERS
ncbi:hypothetical protein [Nocardia abscessus]|uniref:hypothetical protein n=1 Tax=Nocardia abscessus TaxID=120957 RepID=UPI00245876F6|nr:hypothetical protein [Nocardia abscessus]